MQTSVEMHVVTSSALNPVVQQPVVQQPVVGIAEPGEESTECRFRLFRSRGSYTVYLPVTIFHYEVITVGDKEVARITTKVLHVSFCLVVVAVINFVWDLGRSNFTMAAAVWNLATALALPACGVIGVRDKNTSCLQYFCCCNYICAFFTMLSFIGALVALSSSDDPTTNQTLQMVLLFFFFVVYCRGGGLSQQLQEQPYFTQERTNPRQPYNIHQNTVECNPQPVAQAAFVERPPASLAVYGQPDGTVAVMGHAISGQPDCPLDAADQLEAGHVPTATALPTRGTSLDGPLGDYSER